MTDNGGRAGRGLAISGAFIGQVGIFMGIGALLAGVASGPVTVSASGVSAAPAIAAPPAIFAPSLEFAYTFSLFGPTSGGTVSGVYPENQSELPMFRIPADQLSGIKLGATMPDTAKITSLTVTFVEMGPDGGNSVDHMLYQDAKQPLGPGQYTFVSGWPDGGAQPGTRWLVSLTAESDGMSDISPIATVIVTP